MEPEQTMTDQELVKEWRHMYIQWRRYQPNEQNLWDELQRRGFDPFSQA